MYDFFYNIFLLHIMINSLHDLEQINVQDSNDNSSQSSMEQSSHIYSMEPGASKRRDLNVDDKRDACSSGSASRDEPSAESLEGNLRSSSLKKF